MWKTCEFVCFSLRIISLYTYSVLIRRVYERFALFEEKKCIYNDENNAKTVSTLLKSVVTGVRHRSAILLNSLRKMAFFISPIRLYNKEKFVSFPRIFFLYYVEKINSWIANNGECAWRKMEPLKKRHLIMLRKRNNYVKSKRAPSY